MQGVTNPLERDKQPREPVFIISKQFLPGKTLRPGVYTETGIRTLAFSGICGSNQFLKVNYIEISYGLANDKELVKTSCERVFHAVAEHVQQKGFASLEIPEVGVLIIKNDLAAVHFQESLKGEVRCVLSRSIQERKERVESDLTMKNIRVLAGDIKEEKSLKIEEDAKKWLKNCLNLDVDGIFGEKNKEIDDKEDKKEELNGFNEVSKSGNQDVLFDSVSKRNYTASRSFEKSRKIGKNKLNGPFEIAIKKIKTWLKIMNLKPSDGFFELANAGIGKSTNIGSRFSRETLRSAFDKHNLNIVGIEVII